MRTTVTGRRAGVLLRVDLYVLRQKVFHRKMTTQSIFDNFEVQLYCKEWPGSLQSRSSGDINCRPCCHDPPLLTYGCRSLQPKTRGTPHALACTSYKYCRIPSRHRSSENCLSKISIRSSLSSLLLTARFHLTARIRSTRVVQSLIHKNRDREIAPVDMSMGTTVLKPLTLQDMEIDSKLDTHSTSYGYLNRDICALHP